jgi:hypothetical protein
MNADVIELDEIGAGLRSAKGGKVDSVESDKGYDII